MEEKTIRGEGEEEKKECRCYISILKMIEIYRPNISIKKKRFVISMNPAEFLEQVLDFLKSIVTVLG